MFTELAVRNVRRQIGNYLIYFITVALTVSLMFAVNNIIFNEQILAYAETMKELKSGMIGISVFLSLIVAFVLSYATSFMLRLRKREFGMYLTLGMTRKNILLLFNLETLIMGAAALGLGLLLGLFFYQGLMLIMTHLLDMDFAFAAYSAQGLILTIVLVTAVFLISSAVSARYLKKVSIFHLLHGDRMVERNVRRPGIWMILTVASFVTLTVSFLFFQEQIRASLLRDVTPGSGLFVSLMVFAAALILFHISLARSIVNLLLKNRRFCSSGTNTFTLRQLSGKLRSNSVIVGILSFLIAFAVIGSNVSFVMKVSERLALDREYPFDINANLDASVETSVGPDQAEEIISQYAGIEEVIPYTIYTTGASELHQYTRWSGASYEGLHDSLMAESDFNLLLNRLGREPVRLDGSFLICANSNVPQAAHSNFQDAALSLGGKTYRYQGMISDLPMFYYTYFFAVVPDEAVHGLTVESNCVAFRLKDADYDPQELRSALSYSYTSKYEDHTYERCDYKLKEYGRLQKNSTTAIFVIGALYIAVVFIFMAMAILALKTLSGITEDRKRYAVLYRLGAGEREQCQTLFRQTFGFFFLPFALPLLLSIPTSMVSAEIMTIAGFAGQAWEIYRNAGLIAAAILLIYLLYFTATYLIEKRNVVQSKG